jgi:HEAT repeats
MRALPLGLMILAFMGIPLADATSHAHPANEIVIGVLDFQMSPPLAGGLEEKKTGLMEELTPNNRVKLVEISEPVPQEAKETPAETESFLIENGSKLIAGGKYNLVLDKIKDLPDKAKNTTEMRTLECFANLMGWVIQKNPVCKTRWWALRTELIKLGDNEATPMLVIFLKDKDPYLRLYAAELLSHIGDKRALNDLREAGENDGNPQVRKNAKWAYEQISGKKF